MAKGEVMDGDRFATERSQAVGGADAADFAALYHGCWRDLCQFLRKRFGAGPPDPEDVAQSAFLKLAEQRFDRMPNPQAMLYRTAINLMIDQLRQQSRRRRLLNGAIESAHENAHPSDNPERDVLGNEQLVALERAILALPPRHRSYFLANRLDKLSYAEIARRTGASQSMVRKVVEEALAACHAAVVEGKIDYRGLSRERDAD